MEAVFDRINRAPEKHALALMDTLGVTPVPAHPARTPIVFSLVQGAASASAPAGTQVAAPPPPGKSEQIVFETERSCGVMAGKVEQAVSLWPGRDSYIDHTADVAAGKPSALFDRVSLKPIPHEIYLAHPELLALAGNVQLDLEFQLKQGSGEALSIEWEYWDSKVWRGFRSVTSTCSDTTSAARQDGTQGLQKSGTIHLTADCAKSAPLRVNGTEAFWLRGTLSEPLPAMSSERGTEAFGKAGVLPDVEGIRISSTVSRTLLGSMTLSAVAQAPVMMRSFASRIVYISGRVLNEAGQEIAGAVVSLFDLDQQPPAQLAISEKTDDRGHYLLKGPELSVDGRYLLRVSFFDVVAEIDVSGSQLISRRTVDLTVGVTGLLPDKAFVDGTSLDLTKPFLPLGAQPQPGSAFYFTSAEIFAKPGAKMRIFFAKTAGPQDQSRPQGATELPHLVAWEYWNGRQWVTVAVSGGEPALDFKRTEVIDLNVPDDMEITSVNNTLGRWMRARLVSGGYGYTQVIRWKVEGVAQHNEFPVSVTQPPILNGFQLGYTWQYGPFYPEVVLTYNDFAYVDRTDEARWPGSSFQPFVRTADTTPALYLGINEKPPGDLVGLYLDFVESDGAPQGPELEWEYWDGFSWRNLPVEDGTARLRLPGIVAFAGAHDSKTASRFGTALHWLRARLKEDGEPGAPALKRVISNAVWASQQRTFRDVSLGATRGVPSEVLSIAQVPVLEGEQVEVRELTGARAAVEWRLLALEVSSGDTNYLSQLETLLGAEAGGTHIVLGRLRLRRDRAKKVFEVWVRWESRPHLLFSGPRDRHYAIDRVRGRLQFGDGMRGKTAPPNGSVMARLLRSGGGSHGNVASGAVSQLLGAVPGIQSVNNPKAAEGGADTESLTQLLARAPGHLGHAGRAVSARALEIVAREASPGLGFVRAIPRRDPAGRERAGWVTLLLIPESNDPRPWPSFQLREAVRKYVEDRADATLGAGARIHVAGPNYLGIDVNLTITPKVLSDAGRTEKAAREALTRFFHPLRGGPGGTGWDLGRDVYLSDVASVVEAVDGVDYVKRMELAVQGIPQGERVAVPKDRVVMAGDIRIGIGGQE
jgi:hypothetical protein